MGRAFNVLVRLSASKRPTANVRIYVRKRMRGDGRRHQIGDHMTRVRVRRQFQSRFLSTPSYFFRPSPSTTDLNFRVRTD